jgi:acetyl-CoA C-acetyltransferase
VRLSLQAMEATRNEPDEAKALALQSTAIDELIVSADMAEGMAAFAQKRPPQWKNR